MLGHWYILLFQTAAPVVESEDSTSGWVDTHQINPTRNKTKRRRKNNFALLQLGNA